MTNLEKVQAKAKELGRCLCDISIKCECDYFKDFKKCKCSGDEVDHEEWLHYNHPELLDN